MLFAATFRLLRRIVFDFPIKDISSQDENGNSYEFALGRLWCTLNKYDDNKWENYGIVKRTNPFNLAQTTMIRG